MPGEEAAAGILAVPIWLAGTAAAVFVVAILLAVKRAGGVALVTSLFRVGLVATTVVGAWVYVEQRGSKRSALDYRKVALIAGSIAPGSALSCLDELAGEAVEAACEKAVFASPEAVASAVKYVAAQFALLKDGTANTPELAPLRTAIELDRFGLVAQMLKESDGCTVERCDALAQLHDSNRVLGNLRERTFEVRVEKYTAIWNAPRPATGVAMTGPSVALLGTSGLGSVPRYPAAAEPALQSATFAPPADQGNVTPPPAEAPPPRGPAAAEPASLAATIPQAARGSVAPPPREIVTPPLEEAAAEPDSQSAAVTPSAAPESLTPLPPRRPPQVRAGTPHVAAPP
jgi:hypothetical protein